MPRIGLTSIRSVLLCSLIILATGCTKPSTTRWTMLNVTPKEEQADCHLLEFSDGRKVLIDAADATDAQGIAVDLLKERDVRRLDLVVITHFHADHYGRLRDIINTGIKVDRVAINLPASREIADLERPWGCDWDDVWATLRFLSDHNIPFFIPKAGERLIEVKRGTNTTSLDVVCLYDGIKTPVGRTDINDTSIILKLSHPPSRVLFTGDLNEPLGAWLAKSDIDISADILKVPHHGTEGLAPNEFFEKVGPKIALVPSPRTLWLSTRSQRPREWFAQRNIPVYVAGIHGSVVVELRDDGFEVRSEYKAK